MAQSNSLERRAKAIEYQLGRQSFLARKTASFNRSRELGRLVRRERGEEVFQFLLSRGRFHQPLSRSTLSAASNGEPMHEKMKPGWLRKLRLWQPIKPARPASAVVGCTARGACSIPATRTAVGATESLVEGVEALVDGRIAG